jgi:hypothetical protein
MMNSKQIRCVSGKGLGLNSRTLFKVFSFAAWLGLAGTGFGQNTMTSLTEELDRAGFGFYNLSVFGGYITSNVPQYSASGAISSYGFHSWNSGVQASLGWRAKRSERLHFDARFSPSYYYQTSSSGFQSSRFMPNNNAQLSWSQIFGNKWTVNAGLNVAVSDYNQLLLLSDPNQILTGLPGTPGQFANAVLTGTGTNGSLNAAANGPAAIVAGQQNLLYGNRILTGAGSAAVSYAVSPRLRITGAFSAARMQHLDDNSSPQTAYLLQQSTSLAATLSATYALSERTNINGSVSYSRSLSSLYSTPSMNVMVGFSRKISEHFFGRAAGGVGYLLPASNGPQTTFSRTQWQASAGLGYRLLRHSFVGNVSRTVSDNFGLGASSTMLAHGGWTWSPLGSDWAFTAGAAEQLLSDTQFGRQGYRIMGGATHTVGHRVFMSLSYGYGSGNSLLLGTGNIIYTPHTSTSHSVRLNVGFRPHLGSAGSAAPVPGEGGFGGIGQP